MKNINDLWCHLLFLQWFGNQKCSEYSCAVLYHHNNPCNRIVLPERAKITATVVGAPHPPCTTVWPVYTGRLWSRCGGHYTWHNLLHQHCLFELRQHIIVNHQNKTTMNFLIQWHSAIWSYFVIWKAANSLDPQCS